MAPDVIRDALATAKPASTWPAQPLDPIIVAGPWLVAGGLAYLGLKALVKPLTGAARR